MSLRQLLSRHTRVPIILSSRTYIGLPDEVQMLKDMTRTFAEQELAPIAGKIDKGRVRRFFPSEHSRKNVLQTELIERSICIPPNKLLKCQKWV